MFCKKCGAEVPDGKNFCPACGASLRDTATAPNDQMQSNAQNAEAGAQDAQPIAQNAEASAQSAQPAEANKEGKSGKTVKIAVAAVAVLVIILIIAAIAKGGSKSSGYPEYSSKVGVFVEDEYLFNLNGDSEEIDEGASKDLNSYDLNTLVYRTRGRELYYAKRDLKAVQIDEDVTEFQISADGSVVAYQVDDSIYLYRIGKGDSKEVATDLYSSDWCISPDGKTVLYKKDSSKGYSLYIAGWSKDEEKVAGEADPIAVSDGGKYKYYAQNKDGEARLYLASGSKEGEKIDTLGSSTLYVNEDYTEIMYVNSKGSTYVYNIKKKEPVKVTGKAFSDLLTEKFYDLGGDYAYVLMDDSFKSQVFYADGTLYWINSKYEGVKITSSYAQYQLSSDGQSLLYTTNKGKLMKVEKFSNNMKETELYSGDEIEYFIASDDLSKIYFVTEEDELFYYVSAKKQEKLLTDANDIDAIAYNNAEGKLYYVVDDDLYSVSSKASSKNKEAEEVTGIAADGFKGILYANEDGEIYYKETGKWKLILAED